MYYKIKRSMVFLCALVLFLTAMPIHAAENHTIESTESKVIRVGFPIQGGLSYKDADGNYSGYTYDYLQEISQYTGWKYEFVEVPGDADEALMTMLEMLQNGEIDILGGMMKNQYTQEMFDFPETAYGFRYTILGALEANTTINETNYHGIKGLRIGINKKSVQTRAKAESFCEANNIDYSFTEFVDSDEMMQALKAEQVDLIVDNDLRMNPEIRPVAQFDGSPFYFAVTKGKNGICDKLNQAILTIQRSKPYYTSDLNKKHFSNDTYELYISEEEKKYTKTAAPIRIAMVETMEPIQYIDGDGNLAGISVDILNIVEEKTGLVFEKVLARNFEEAFRMLDTGQADSICGIPYDYITAQKYSLIMSNNFLTVQTALVIPKETENISAFNKAGFVNRMLDSQSLDSDRQKVYTTTRDCMNAVASGEVDCAYMNMYSAQYLSYEPKYSKLRFIAQAGKDVEFCIGVKKPVDTRLISILNKAITNLSDKELESIVYSNTVSNKQKVTLTSVIEGNPIPSIIAISAVFLIVLAIIAWILRTRVQTAKHLYLENQRYLQLSELSNEYIFEYNRQKDEFSFSGKFSQLFDFPDKIANAGLTVSQVEDYEKEYQYRLSEVFQRVVQGGAETEFEWKGHLPGGEDRWYRCTKADIRDEDGTLVHVIGKLTDIQNEKDEKKHLERRAQMDGLTGIYNAIASKDRIGKRLEELQGNGGLLIIDIDNFKNINDQLGHYIGDIVLQDFAAMLKDQGSIAGRLGGDEFVLYIDSVENEESLQSFCTLLRQKAVKTYYAQDGTSLAATISIGAALVKQSCTFNQLYQAVDKALYISKNEGRNRHTVFTYPNPH